MATTIANNNDRPIGNPVVVLPNERPTCAYCGKPMRIRGKTHRLIVGLEKNFYVRSPYYKCGDAGCPAADEPLVCYGDDYAPPGGHYSYQIISHICWLRFSRRMTLVEVQAELRANNGIKISLSAISDFLKIYEIAAERQYRPAFVEKVRANGGIILTIDGCKPLKGNKGLYVIYDYLTNQTLGAKRLPNERADTIADFLQAVVDRVAKELDAPILAVVSDALPSQRLAIKKVLPGVPLCLCHFHFLKLVLQAPLKADSALLTPFGKPFERLSISSTKKAPWSRRRRPSSFPPL
ncbi:MAG: hypothetical protein ACTSRZ_14225 [Promethearchaeota archaeon]